MALAPGFPLQLAQNAALLGGLVVLHGLVLRTWHPRDVRAIVVGGLLFGLATLAEPVLALNVSAAQLSVPGFGARAVARLRGWGVPAGALEIELTETAVLDDHRPEVRASLEALRAAGLGLVNDDFGTGYSSLLTLQRLDVRKLKIPRGFVTQLPGSRADLAIVRATLQLGRALGLTVQAEGVEAEAQAALLADLGCELAQGHLFDRPLEQADYEARLAEQAAAPLTSPAGSPRT